MPRWRAQHSPEFLLPALRQWFKTPVGQTVLQEEQQLISEAIETAIAPGHRILGLSIIPERCCLDVGNNGRVFRLGSSGHYGFTQVLDAICDFDRLPVESESQDIVVLHHLLEFVENPHSVLREVERVMVPHGRLIVCGINPWSLLALRGVMGRLRRSAMWQHHSLSLSRVNDWLSLLGFEADETRYAFHRLPVNRPAFFMNHRAPASRFPMGGVYVLNAVKYRAPLTPSEEGLRRRAQVLAHPAMLGATRGISASPQGMSTTQRVATNRRYRRRLPKIIKIEPQND